MSTLEAVAVPLLYVRHFNEAHWHDVLFTYLLLRNDDSIEKSFYWFLHSSLPTYLPTYLPSPLRILQLAESRLNQPLLVILLGHVVWRHLAAFVHKTPHYILPARKIHLWEICLKIGWQLLLHLYSLMAFYGPTPAPFSFIFSLFKQTIQFVQQIMVKIVISIQYTAPGFEPTTSQTWVVSHNHSTRAPALSIGFYWGHLVF